MKRRSRRHQSSSPRLEDRGQGGEGGGEDQRPGRVDRQLRGDQVRRDHHVWPGTGVRKTRRF